MTNRRRRAKPDQLLAPDLHEQRNAITIGAMLAPLDRLQEQMALKWGEDRMPGLLPTEPPPHVPPDKLDDYRSIPRRYGEALEALERAVAARDVDAAKAAGDRVAKAIRIMDRQLEAAGIKPPAIHYVETVMDGRAIAIVSDSADWQRLSDERPDLTIHTVEEAAAALLRQSAGVAMLGEAKRIFGNVEILRTHRKETPDDPIPFP